MEPLKCDFCGAGLVMDKSREFATCEFCGTKYLKETIREKIQQIRGEVSVVGAVETVTGDAEKERLIKNAETYMSIREYDKAVQTYKQITQLFPDDYRGWWGLFTTPIERYFATGKFTECEQNALRNTCRLCKDRAVIDNYFVSVCRRYGEAPRTVFNSEKVCLLLTRTSAAPPKLDSFTEWLIFCQGQNIPYFSDNFRKFVLSLSNRYVLMAKNGTIFVNINCKQPVMIKEPLFWFLQGVQLPAYVSFIAQINKARYSEARTSPEPNSPVFFKIGWGNNYVDVTEIRGFCGRWIFATNRNGENIAIMSSREILLTDWFKYINHCQYCGGNFKGAFKKVCSQCGAPKDY